jgi:hypothetical protein
LRTWVDLAADADPHDVSLSARHEAVLSDGRRVVLLENRGWHERLGLAPARREADLWLSKTAGDLEKTARSVVGPDEAFEGRSRADVEAGHWRFLADLLLGHGVEVDPRELRALPHDVELSDEVRLRVEGARSDR